jgi:methionyl-tRNA synthetase
VADIPAKLEAALENYKFRDALVLAMEIARLGNKYLAEAEPWKIMKEDTAKAGTVLNYAVQLVAQASIALEPFIPFSAQKLRSALGMTSFEWSSLGNFEVISAGTALQNPGLLFEKIEDEEVQKQVDKLTQTKAQMELASKSVKSKKLLKLQVNDGFVTRTILSGIAEHYVPEDLVGKQVTFLANLAPRKMMGIESEGMILMAEDADGSLALVQPNKQIWNGGTVN